MIAMLENLKGRIDEALPVILQILVNELNKNTQQTAKTYMSMIM